MAPRPLVFCGPSGAGKSTLLKKLMADHPDRFGFSVSHTTRSPRSGEVDGREYHFIDTDTFTRQLQAGAFLETAMYSGNHYGTSYRALLDVLESGQWCILDIDVQGVQQLKQSKLLTSQYVPVYVFIFPPSIEHLKERLTSRQTDSAEAIALRLAKAEAEMAYGHQPGNFDLVVVNDDLEAAYAKLNDFLSPLLAESGDS
ncbi:guanylate kinase isoform X2 [Hyalella azteca]|nr:guanylate kinase isoform X2 [Hyalella azteca]